MEVHSAEKVEHRREGIHGTLRDLGEPETLRTMEALGDGKYRTTET